MEKMATPVKFKCEYCNKSFVREKTLASHTCEQKRRHMQKDDPDVRLGYRAFQLFYRIGTNSRKPKSYEDFAGSNYYSAFVKFGMYAIDLKIDDFEGYTTWLLKNSVRLDSWTRDTQFNLWNKERLKKESCDRAVERTIMFMNEWAESTNMNWNDYWQHANINQIVFHICSGRISPWVIYSSETAQNLLDSMNGDQLGLIVDYIDPQYWQRKLKTNAPDFAWVESIIG